MSFWTRHQIFEKNSIVLIVGILAVIAIGGLVEITPLFYLKSTIEVVDGVRPYTPLELTGRNIYVREGCYLCHSQMIRPLRDEVERYGHYSLAAESMYDHPFQWGSKRTGPDLARVGAKYSDEWHVTHLAQPARDRSAVGDARLSVPRRDRDRHRNDCRSSADQPCRRRALFGRPDRQCRCRPEGAGRSGQCRHRRFCQTLPEGGGAQFRRQGGSADRNGCAGRVSCRCSAPWSISNSTTKKQIFAERIFC